MYACMYVVSLILSAVSVRVGGLIVVEGAVVRAIVLLSVVFKFKKCL